MALRLSRSRWAAACALAYGCGDGALPDSYQPLPDAPKDVHVAVGWNVKVSSAGLRHVITQDFDISMEDPSRFHIGQLEPPPSETLELAMFPGDDHPTRVAIGNLLAYRDLNGNGRLDFTPVDASAFVDELIAVDGTLMIRYEENRSPAFSFHSAINHHRDPLSLEPVTRLSDCSMLEWEPAFLGEPEHLGLSPSDPWYPEGEGRCPADFVPPDRALLVCYGNGYSAEWTTETSSFVRTTCGRVVRSCFHELGGANYPCPCTPGKYICSN